MLVIAVNRCIVSTTQKKAYQILFFSRITYVMQNLKCFQKTAKEPQFT